MHWEGLYSNHTWELISPLLKEHAENLSDAVKEVIQVDPIVEAEEIDTAQREYLRAQRSAFLGLLKDGVISEEIFLQLARGIDEQLAKDHSTWLSLIKKESFPPLKVDRLMAAVVQVQDVENAIHGINDAGLVVTRMPSSGAFLGRKNVTLLIGLAEGQEELAISALAENCRRRVEYLSSPIEGVPLHIPITTPITVGGATIFTLAVEHYEEI
jgi:uncharacterized protein YaaQ